MTLLVHPPQLQPDPKPGRPTESNELIVQFDRLIDLASGRINSHPWLVVMIMHEVFRNLYPADPFIPFDADEPPATRIARVMDECAHRIQVGGAWPSYFGTGRHAGDVMRGRQVAGAALRSAEAGAQQLYGALWDRFDTDVYIDEASRILRERFASSGFLDDIARDSTILDAGCGSGRYTMALARLCPARVTGLDLGATSLGHARRIAADAGISNIEFRTGNVLKLPFPDNSIDCIFSNGVLHHTGDTARGLREMHRVLRPGGRAFLYLYGAGGLFWHARRAARPVIQRIPREYTVDVLSLIGMPANRFIFVDTWYVPIEEHIGRDALESLLAETGFSHAIKLISRRATDLDSTAVMATPDYSAIWGDGEHRYLLTKT